MRMANITAEDFRAFTVSDDAGPCDACLFYEEDTRRAPAPIRVKNKRYCLWCALELARDLLKGSA
jgi:hypothetical protein